MKALIYNPFWDTMGGGERYTSTLVRLLLDQKWQVDILWPKNLSMQIKDIFGLDLRTANWIDINYSPLSSFNYQLLFWLSDGSLPLSFSGRTIIHLQFPFTNIKGRHFKNFLKSRLFTFVVNSGFTKQFIDKEFLVDSRVIHPPIDISLFNPGKKQKIILYVGRFSSLTQFKGHDILIDYFSRTHKRFPGWKLVLAGGTAVGTESKVLEQLRRQSSRLPLEIIANPNLNKLRQLYAKASVFWSASGFGTNEIQNPVRVEHFGITVVEAMAAGCVPIVTNLGGHKEIIAQGSDGFLYDKISELGDYTYQLITSPKLMHQLSQSAMEKSKIFSTQMFYSKFTSLINS